jgi:hypothetical protein
LLDAVCFKILVQLLINPVVVGHTAHPVQLLLADFGPALVEECWNIITSSLLLLASKRTLHNNTQPVDTPTHTVISISGS